MSGVIRIGCRRADKEAVVRDFMGECGASRLVIVTPAKLSFPCSLNAETIFWEQVIKYKTFYRLLQEINLDTLVVVNECLRTQERSCLHYNCIRHYLQQAGHALVFQWLPLIDQPDDCMILLDFATRSRWRREAFRPEFFGDVKLLVEDRSPELAAVPIALTQREQTAYTETRDKLFAGIGLKDPHTLPRQLHLVSGRAKLRAVDRACRYVGRNDRFKIGCLTFKEDDYPDPPYTSFEFPHSFIDFADFLSLSGQQSVKSLVADAKADQWYLARYQAWSGRQRDAIAALRR